MQGVFGKIPQIPAGHKNRHKGQISGTVSTSVIVRIFRKLIGVKITVVSFKYFIFCLIFGISFRDKMIKSCYFFNEILQGFNSGVVLYHLDRMRNSNLYNRNWSHIKYLSYIFRYPKNIRISNIYKEFLSNLSISLFHTWPIRKI